MGTWIVAQDGPDKVIKVDGSNYAASKSTPERLLIENSRKMYGTSNEELLDNAKQFTFYPVAVLKTVDNFSNGTISVKFKTIDGQADRASGILGSASAETSPLAGRPLQPDTEHNLVMWEFHNGVRRPLNHHGDSDLLSAAGDREKWHDLKINVDGGNITAFLDGTKQWDYVLDAPPGPSAGAAHEQDLLYPANNRCCSRR